MQRRAAVRHLAWMLAGITAQACTPLRIISGAFPDEFKDDPQLVTDTLRAFVAAVVPGCEPGTTVPERALLDRRYPFAKYAAFFASDLSARSERRFGTPAFAPLSIDQRAAVVQDGLAADGTTQKLYRGAIYLTQVSIYAGIYDDESGCALIDFPGRYHGATVSYDNPGAYLPAPLTPEGNCA